MKPTKPTNVHSRREKLMLQAARMLNSTVDYEELIHLALNIVCKAVSSEATYIFRLDEKIQHRRVRVLVSGCEELAVARKELGCGVTGWVIDHGAPALINDVSADERFHDSESEGVNIPIKSMLAIPLISRGKIIGALAAVNSKTGEFSEVDQDTMVGLSDQIAISLENSQLLRAARREANEREHLLKVVTKLSGALDLDEALTLILDAVEELVGFNAGGIFLVDRERGEFGKIYSRGYEDVREDELHIKLDKGLIGWVAKNNRPILVPDVLKDERYVGVREGTRSELVAPMSINSTVVGVFNLECDDVEAYDGHSEDLLVAFGAQAAMVIQRTQMHEQIVKAQALARQVEIAHEIQSEFLPDSDPEISGYEIAGMNVASGEVGGDYYGYIPRKDKSLGVAIADVAGKGVPAGLLMASFRASLIAEVRNEIAVGSAFARVNDLMHESVEPGDYVTAVYGSLDYQEHSFRYSNAGHNPPLLIRTSGAVEELTAGGVPLGIVADAEFGEGVISLGSGDLLALFTDGVTESEADSGELYGEERLISFLKRHQSRSAIEIRDLLYKEICAFATLDVPPDDITMIILRRV
jgi:serine phosphatase RsbU (regulator of sigma subunit)